ncbi:metallopeptidase TldD-related protein [Deferribacter thermophilus]|uniref:TldD/PmbA family protein n=1 Tax=Deferribacter thermophilus TaxID=53573 RepID=UPI003C226AEB
MDYLTIIEEGLKVYDDIQLLIVENETKKVTVKHGEIEDFLTSINKDHFIRIIKDGKHYSFRVSGGDLKEIKKVLNEVKDIFLYLTNENYELNRNYSKYDKELYLKDNFYYKMNNSQLVNTALEIEASALNYSKYVKNVRYTNFTATLEKKYLLFSDGEVLTEESTNFSGSTYVVAEKDGDSQSGYDFSSSVYFDDFEYNLIGQRAAIEAVSLLGGKKLKSGKYYIVFKNTIMAEFLELIEYLVNAENILKNKSLMKDMLGKEVASKNLSIVDNSKIERGVGSYCFDDEGVVGGRTEIIKNGILKGILHNNFTSKKLNQKNTGNASITGSVKVDISASNLILSGEQIVNFDVLKDYNDVLLVTDVMGMHMADPISGDFSIGISGIYFKNGEEVTPFNEMVLTGNITDLLKNVIAVFDDTRDFGGVITPSIMFDKFMVSGS